MDTRSLVHSSLVDRLRNEKWPAPDPRQVIGIGTGEFKMVRRASGQPRGAKGGKFVNQTAVHVLTNAHDATWVVTLNWKHIGHKVTEKSGRYILWEFRL